MEIEEALERARRWLSDPNWWSDEKDTVASIQRSGRKWVVDHMSRLDVTFPGSRSLGDFGRLTVTDAGEIIPPPSQATIEAALRELALNDVKDPGGFFGLAGDPDRLDSELQERYVGMSAEDAASAAIRVGITNIRVFRLPFHRPYIRDHLPDRLNLAVIDGRVVRVAFF